MAKKVSNVLNPLISVFCFMYHLLKDESVLRRRIMKFFLCNVYNGIYTER